MSCVGDCCASFFLDEETQLGIMNGQEPDEQTIRVMLIPLDGEGHFTCRHWDPETKLCGIYESRPEMCRDFPDEGEGGCDLPGCTL